MLSRIKEKEKEKQAMIFLVIFLHIFLSTGVFAFLPTFLFLSVAPPSLCLMSSFSSSASTTFDFKRGEFCL